MGITVRGQVHRVDTTEITVQRSLQQTSYQITRTDIGLGEVWANTQFCWTSIPKNANMVYRKILKDLDVPITRYRDDLGLDHSIFVIRDPRTRLLSGLGEYRKRRHSAKWHSNPDISVKHLLEDLINDPTCFDEHLEPQVAFIAGKSYTEILMFENLYQETLAHPFFAGHQQIVDRYMNAARLNNSKHHQQDLQQLIQEHQVLVDKAIELYYSVDYEIWSDPTSWINKLI